MYNPTQRIQENQKNILKKLLDRLDNTSHVHFSPIRIREVLKKDKSRAESINFHLRTTRDTETDRRPTENREGYHGIHTKRQNIQYSFKLFDETRMRNVPTNLIGKELVKLPKIEYPESKGLRSQSVLDLTNHAVTPESTDPPDPDIYNTENKRSVPFLRPRLRPVGKIMLNQSVLFSTKSKKSDENRANIQVNNSMTLENLGLTSSARTVDNLKKEKKKYHLNLGKFFR